MRIRLRHLLVVGGLAVGVVLGPARASVPQDGVYTGCHLASGGTLQVIDPSVTNCKATEPKSTWNERGQPGAPGPRALMRMDGPNVDLASDRAVEAVPSQVWGFIGLPDREVLSLATAPGYSHTHTLLAGTDAGLYVSTDAGSSWTLSSLRDRVIALALSPAFEEDHTGFALVAFPTSYGLFRTVDGGLTWTGVASPPGKCTLSVTVSPSFPTDGTVFVGQLRSTDGGTTWSTMPITSHCIYSLQASPDYHADHTVFAGTSDGVLRSTDGGTTWAASNSGLTITTVGQVAVSPAYASDHTVFVAGNPTSDTTSMFTSTDGGASWTAVGKVSSQSVYASALVLSPAFASDRTMVLGTNVGLYMSTDAGSTFTQVEMNSGLQTTSVRSAAISPDYASDRTLVVGTVGGVFSYPRPRDEVYVILDATGWSDPSVGTWDKASLTGTLTTDVSRMVLVEGNGLTLDGNGHRVAGVPERTDRMWSVGVFAGGRSSLRVERLTVTGFAFGIALRSTTGSTLSDNDASGNKVAGIWLLGSANNTVTQNIADGGLRGIGLWESNSNAVTHNRANGHLSADMQHGTGIALWEAFDNSLAYNTLDANYEAIELAYSGRNQLQHNTATASKWNGVYLYSSGVNTLSNNTIGTSFLDGVWLNASNLNTFTANDIVSNRLNGIRMTNGYGTTLKGNNISGNGGGLDLEGAGNNDVSGNLITGNAGGGIEVVTYANASILGNAIRENGFAGIWVDDHSTATVTDNTIKANGGRGVGIADHSNATVVNNDFLANVATLDSSSTATFNKPAPIGGNYWSVWTTPDADNDGFVDVPYVIGATEDALPWTTETGWSHRVTPAPTLSLTKAAAPGSYTAVGQVIDYTLVATNDGNVTLSNVSISDPQLDTLTCTPSQPATLAPHQSLTCTGSHTVTRADLDAGSVSNTAKATGEDPQGQPVVSPPASLTVPAVQPHLSLTKSADAANYDHEGQVVNYTLVATNDGDLTLSNVSISDPQLKTLTCTPSQPATLAPEASLTCTGSYAVAQTDLDAGLVKNTASASGSGPQGQPASATANATVTAVQTPELSLTKSANPTIYAYPGQVTVYTFVMKNTGNVTLSGPFNITDDKLGVFQCGSATSLALGATVTCTESYTIQASDLNVTNNASITNQATATGKFGTTTVTSNQAQATINQTAPTGKITNATCQMFAGGTYGDLTDESYTVRANEINSIAPGVFFYYSKITPLTSSLTIQVTQSDLLGWTKLGTRQLILWNANCVKTAVTGTYDSATGTVTFNATGLTAGAIHYVSIKYEPGTLVGQNVGNKPYPTDAYTFKTYLNGTEIISSWDSINVKHKL